MIGRRPDISICIPVYNGARYIAATLESVLSQDFSNFNLIILDNASVDQTRAIIASYNDDRITLLSRESTSPPWINWSSVVSEATAPWTKLLCADDVLLPGALSHTFELMKFYPNAGVIAGSRNIIGPDGRTVMRSRPAAKKVVELDYKDFTQLIIKIGTNPIGESCCISWRTELTPVVGNFSNYWKYFMDLDYWIRLSALTTIVVSPIEIASFRVSPQSWTSTIGISSAREAKLFFTTHEAFKCSRKYIIVVASLKALFRSIARQTFIKLSIHKSRN